MFVWFIVYVSLDQHLSHWLTVLASGWLRSGKHLQGSGPVDQPRGPGRSDVLEVGCSKAFNES